MDTLAQLYNRKYSHEAVRHLELKPNAFSTSRYDDVARLLPAERESLLEVGCGSGSLCFALAPNFEKVVGVDLSPTRIATANQVLSTQHAALASRCRFVCQAVDVPLPFADASFDVVIACAILEHVVDVFAAIDEIARVCKSGGSVIITVPNVCYVKHVASLLVGEIPLTGTERRGARHFREQGWDGGHLHYFSRKSLTDLLLHVGFRPEKWTGDGRWARVRRWNTNLVGNLTVLATRD
jgi:2-polyprenyl-3-methyl-5-hydroxy-6-metoxy-1,4-benzoquinol methylase